MKHYICLGGCKGVSSNPGVCNAPDCKDHNHALVECVCSDGLHGDFKLKEINNNFNGFFAFIQLLFVSVISYFVTLFLLLAIFPIPGGNGLGGLAYFFFPIPIVIIVFFIGIVRILVKLKKVRSSIVNQANDLSSSDEKKLILPIKVSYFEKFLAIAMFIVNVGLYVYYLIPFAKYHKYVESFSGKYNQEIYGLKYLSTSEMFIRTGIILLPLIVISFITIIKSFKNSKSFTTLLIITILSTSCMAITFPYDRPYLGTVYQDGSGSNGGAIDISKTVKAIEDKDINECHDINYYAYEDYCIHELGGELED